jgi:Putative threonine efflux protein
MLSTFPSLLPFLLFAFVTSITPGPTNILVLSNSARYGFKATLPIIFGACASAAAIVLLVGYGLGEPLKQIPLLQYAMQWLGVTWLSYLAWQIYHSATETFDPDVSGNQKRPGLLTPFDRRRPAMDKPKNLDDGHGRRQRVCRQWCPSGESRRLFKFGVFRYGSALYDDLGSTGI